MAIRYIFLFRLLISTHQRAVVDTDSQCKTNLTKWLGGQPIDECNIVKRTLTVRLVNLVDRPQCLKENTLIGIKFNQTEENDWDATQELDINEDI